MFDLIIAGGRDFNDFELLKRRVDHIVGGKPVFNLICGMARGADMLGYRWAKERGTNVIRCPANWNLYGKKAGYNRNIEMAMISTHLIAFWDGQSKGTAHMIEIAKLNKLESRIIRY